MENNNTAKNTCVAESSALSRHGINGKSEGLFSMETSERDREECLWSEPGHLGSVKSRPQSMSNAVGKKIFQQGESKQREEIKLCDQVALRENNLELKSPIWASFEVTDSTGSDNVGNGDSINVKNEAASCVVMEWKGQGELLMQSAQNEEAPIWHVENSGEKYEDMMTDMVDSDEEDMLLGNDLAIDEEIPEEEEEINEIDLLGSPEKVGQSENEDRVQSSANSGPRLGGEARSNLSGATSSHSVDVFDGESQQDEKQVETHSLSRLEKIEQSEKMIKEEISEDSNDHPITDEDLSGGEEKTGKSYEDMNDEAISKKGEADLTIDKDLLEGGNEKVGIPDEEMQKEHVSEAETGNLIINEELSDREGEIEKGSLSPIDNVDQCMKNENGEPMVKGEVSSNAGSIDLSQIGGLFLLGHEGDLGTESRCKDVEHVGLVERTDNKLQSTDSSETGRGTRGIRDSDSSDIKGHDTVDPGQQTISDLAIDEKTEKDDSANIDMERASAKESIIACVSDAIENEMRILCKSGEEKENDEKLSDKGLTLYEVEDKKIEARELNETRDREGHNENNFDVMKGREDEEKIDRKTESESEQIKEITEEGNLVENTTGESVSPVDCSEGKSSLSETSENIREEEALKDINTNANEMEDSRHDLFIGDGEQMIGKENKDLKHDVARNESTARSFEQTSKLAGVDRLISGDTKTEEQNTLYDNGVVTKEKVGSVERNEVKEQGKIEELHETECVTENKERQEDESELLLEFFEEEEEENVDSKDDKESREYAEDPTTVGVIDDNTLEKEKERCVDTDDEGRTTNDVLEQEARENYSKQENAHQETNERHIRREDNTGLGTKNLDMDDSGSAKQVSEYETTEKADKSVITKIATAEVTAEMEVDGDASSKQEQSDVIPTERSVIAEITTEMDVGGDASSKQEQSDVIPAERSVIVEITTEMDVDDNANSKQEDGMIRTKSYTENETTKANATDSFFTHQNENECDQRDLVRTDTQIVGTETDETMEANTDDSSLQTNEMSLSNEVTKGTVYEDVKRALVDDTVIEMGTGSSVVACEVDVTDEVVGNTQEGVLRQSSIQEGANCWNEQTEVVEALEQHNGDEKRETNSVIIGDTEDSMLQENSVLKVKKDGNDDLGSDKIQKGNNSKEVSGLVGVKSGEQEWEQEATNSVVDQKSSDDIVTEEETREKSRQQRDGTSEGQALEQGTSTSILVHNDSRNVAAEEEVKEIQRKSKLGKLNTIKLNISNAIKALSSRIKSEPIDSSESIGTDARKASNSGCDKQVLGGRSHSNLLPETVYIKQEPIDDYEYSLQTNGVIATDPPVDESIVKQEDCAASSENVFDMIRSENEIVKEQEAMEIASSLFFDPPDSDSDESDGGEPLIDVVRYSEESNSSGGGERGEEGYAEGGGYASNGSSTCSATSPVPDDISGNASEPDSTSEDTSNNGPNTNSKNLTAAQRLIEKFRLQIQGKLEGKSAAQPKKTPREKLMPAELVRKKEGEKETELVRKKNDKRKQTVPKRKADTASGKTQNKTKRAKIDEAIHKNELEIVKALQGKAAMLKIPATILQDRIKAATGKGVKTNVSGQARLASENTSKNLKTNQASKPRQANERRKTVITPSGTERPKEAPETTLSNTGSISIGTESLLNQDEDKTPKRPPVSNTATKSTTMKVSVKIMCEKGAAYVKITPKGPVNVVEKAVQIITVRRRVPSDSAQHKNSRDVPISQSGPGQDKGADDTNPLSIREKNIQRLKQLIKKQEQAIEKIKSGKEKQIDQDTDKVGGSNQGRDLIVIDEEATSSETDTVKRPEQIINGKTDTGKNLTTKRTITGTTIMTVQGYNHVSPRDSIPGSMKLTISGGKVTSVQPPAITQGKVTSVQPPSITKVTPVKILPAAVVPNAATPGTGGTDGLPRITGICSLAGMKQIPKNMLTPDELDKTINFLSNTNEARLPSRIFNLGPNEKEDILKTLQQARTLMTKNMQTAAEDCAATGNAPARTVPTTAHLGPPGQTISQVPKPIASSLGNSIILTSTLKTGERRITLVPAKPKKQPNSVPSTTPVQGSGPRVKYTSLGLPYALNENEQSDGTENDNDSNVSKPKELLSPKSSEAVQHLLPSVNLQYLPSNQGVALGPTAMEAPINRQSDIQMLNSLVSKQGQSVNNAPGFTVGPRPRLITVTRPGAVVTHATRAMPGGMTRGLPQNSIIHGQLASTNTSGTSTPGRNSGQANSGLEPITAEHGSANAVPVGSNIPKVQMLQPGQPSENQQVQVRQPVVSNNTMPVCSNMPQVQMLQPGQPPSENQHVRIRQPVSSNSVPGLKSIQPQFYQKVVLIQDRGSYALVPIPANANIPGAFHVPVDHRQLMNGQMQGGSQIPRAPLPPYGPQYQGHPSMLPHQGVRSVAVQDPRTEATLSGNVPAASTNVGQIKPLQMPKLAPIDPHAAAGTMASELKQAASANEAGPNHWDATQNTGKPACKTEDAAESLPESADTGKKETLVELKGSKTTKLIIKMTDVAQKKSLFNILPKPSEGTLPDLTPVSGHAQLLARLANQTQIRGGSFNEAKAVLQNALPRSVQVSNVNQAKTVAKDATFKVYPQESFDTSPYWLKHAAKHRIAEHFRCKITSSSHSTSAISNSENDLPEGGTSCSEEITSGKNNAQTNVMENGTSSSKEITSEKSNSESDNCKESASSSEEITSGKSNAQTNILENGTSSSKEITSEKSNSESDNSKKSGSSSEEITSGKSNAQTDLSKDGTSSSKEITSGKTNSENDISEKRRSSSEEITSGKSNSDDEVSRENESVKINTENSTSEMVSCKTDRSVTEDSKKIDAEKGSSENINLDKTKPARLDIKPSLPEQIFQQIKKRSPTLRSKFAVRFGSYENQFSLVNTKRPLWKFLPAAENEEFIMNFGLEEVVDRLLTMPDMKRDKEVNKEPDEREIQVTIDGKELLLDGKNVEEKDNPVHLWKNRIYVDAFKLSNRLQSEINSRKRKKNIANNDSKNDSKLMLKMNAILKDDKSRKRARMTNSNHRDNKNRKRARMTNSNHRDNKNRKRARMMTVERTKREFTKRRVLSQPSQSKDTEADDMWESGDETEEEVSGDDSKESDWNPDDEESESETSAASNSDEENGEVSDSDETSDSDDESILKKYKPRTLTVEELPKVFVKLEDVLLSNTSTPDS